MTKEEQDKYFKKQYEHYGGFCSYCGEAKEPILNNDVEVLGKCEGHPELKGISHSVDVNGYCNMGCC